MIHVIAIITAQPGRRAEVLEAFEANVPAVRAEEGCIEYISAIDVAGAGRIQTPLGADTFVVIEKWASLAALQAHAISPHMKSYATKVKDLLAARAVHVLEPTAK